MSKVLLIEDDRSNRITMSVLLEDEGFDIVEVPQGTVFSAALQLSRGLLAS